MIPKESPSMARHMSKVSKRCLRYHRHPKSHKRCSTCAYVRGMTYYHFFASWKERDITRWWTEIEAVEHDPSDLGRPLVTRKAYREYGRLILQHVQGRHDIGVANCRACFRILKEYEHQKAVKDHPWIQEKNEWKRITYLETQYRLELGDAYPGSAQEQEIAALRDGREWQIG